MARFSRRMIAVVGMGGLTLVSMASSALAQNISPRTRGGGPRQMTGVPASPAQPALPPAAVPPPPVNMLQQPAKDAQVTFSGDHLSIRADNSSLAAILRQVAADSGMKITGLAGDERVFGTFGPGVARDVLLDLLNGTAYDVVLVGNASYGAPRELILTPARGGGPAQTLGPAASSHTAADEAVNDQESQDGPPPPPEAPPADTAVPAGVRTPQQLFQQLQQMRQAQQQQIPQQEQQQTPPQ